MSATTVPASYDASEADTIPSQAYRAVTPLVRAGIDNGVEFADLDAWRCAEGDDARRAREASRLAKEVEG